MHTRYMQQASKYIAASLYTNSPNLVKSSLILSIRYNNYMCTRLPGIAKINSLEPFVQSKLDPKSNSNIARYAIIPFHLLCNTTDNKLTKSGNITQNSHHIEYGTTNRQQSQDQQHQEDSKAGESLLFLFKKGETDGSEYHEQY